MPFLESPVEANLTHMTDIRAPYPPPPPPPAKSRGRTSCRHGLAPLRRLRRDNGTKCQNGHGKGSKIESFVCISSLKVDAALFALCLLGFEVGCRVFKYSAGTSDAQTLRPPPTTAPHWCQMYTYSLAMICSE